MTPPDRYHRQILLPGVGPEGQRLLADSHALLVGVGALGSAIAEHLARAGVGRLTLIDRDVVELTNLQRQSLYSEQDLGLPKVEAAAARLALINSSVSLNPVVADLSSSSARRQIEHAGPSIILDGTDNFDTRYLLNDAAVAMSIPLVLGGVVATRGTHMVVRPGGPCLRCAFPDPPAPGSEPTCDTAGVLGPAVAVVAALQASSALRILLRHPPDLDQLTSLDLWAGEWRRIALSRDDRCPCCQGKDFAFLEGRAGARAVWLCGQNSLQIFPDRAAIETDDDSDTPPLLDLARLAASLAPHGSVSTTRFMTRVTLAHEQGDDGGPIHLSVFPDGRALVRGARDPSRARAIYDRYVGG